MFLKNISLINFKNFEQLDLEFCRKINCFSGRNGSGKTNLMDAVYYLSMCKSFFNAVDSQNIMHGKDFFVIQGTYSRLEEDENIYCGVKRNTKKQFRRNKKDYSRLSDHIGLLPVVMVSPGDSVLITGGSEERRKFMNGVISQYDKLYLEDLIKYNQALTQRNALLKDFARKGYYDAESLDIWTQQLIEPGNRIFNKRVEFLEKLLPIFQYYYDFVSKGKEMVGLIYDSQLSASGFENLFEKSLEKDRILQYTTTGIHKDDLQFLLGDNPIKRDGSQGQQKTYLVALKLAQFDFMKRINGFNPILLFDDVFDKLDDVRVKQIVKLVSANHFGQIFITDTSRERLETILKGIDIEYRLFDIENLNSA